MLRWGERTREPLGRVILPKRLVVLIGFLFVLSRPSGPVLRGKLTPPASPSATVVDSSEKEKDLKAFDLCPAEAVSGGDSFRFSVWNRPCHRSSVFLRKELPRGFSVRQATRLLFSLIPGRIRRYANSDLSLFVSLRFFGVGC